MSEPKIPVSYRLFERILAAFLDMQSRTWCADKSLMEDLDREMAEYDRSRIDGENRSK